MKNPLHYQLSEYDCGLTSMLNAMSYLFQREDLPPEIIRNIMLHCLDCYGSDGVSDRFSRIDQILLKNTAMEKTAAGKRQSFFLSAFKSELIKISKSGYFKNARCMYNVFTN